MYRETGLVNSPPPSAQDDAALLALVQRGDETAMASLFDRYSKIVYSVALRVLRDPASAEDVLQEVFMQIWRNPNGFVATRGSLGGDLAITQRAAGRRVSTLSLAEISATGTFHSMAAAAFSRSRALAPTWSISFMRSPFVERSLK